MKKQKVMLLVNDTTYAYNLRKEVIEKLVAEGYEVVVVCALLLLQEELKALGCRLIGVETGHQGTNPMEDLKLFGQYTEATQYIIKMGWCETDDVIHNTLGTAIGVWVWHLQSKRLNKQNSNKLSKD